VSTFFRFQFDGGLAGLVRRQVSDFGGTEFASLVAGRWVLDQRLYRYWVDPGDVWLVEVTAEHARAVADVEGVRLDLIPLERARV